MSHLLDWTRELMAAASRRWCRAASMPAAALIAVDPNGQEVKLTLRKYIIDVHIEDGFARTTIDQTYFNNQNWPARRDLLLPAAARCLAVAPGHVRRQRQGASSWKAAWPSATTPATSTKRSATPTATRPCSNGSTAAPSRCASFRWKPARKNGSSSATRKGCRCSTAPALPLPRRPQHGAGPRMGVQGRRQEWQPSIWSPATAIRHRTSGPGAESPAGHGDQARGNDYLARVSAKNIKPNQDVTLEIHEVPGQVGRLKPSPRAGLRTLAATRLASPASTTKATNI